jgi:hypothetical protein
MNLNVQLIRSRQHAKPIIRVFFELFSCEYILEERRPAEFGVFRCQSSVLSQLTSLQFSFQVA